jgi:hypothetical protein
MKLQTGYEVEFYVSYDGYLVIKQESFEYGKEITFLLTPEQAKILFAHSEKLLKQQKDRWTGIVLDDKDEE